MTDIFINSRNQYKSPPTGLIFSSPQAKFQSTPYIEHKFNTTLELDTHHHHLLKSDDDNEVLLGLNSVIYWYQNSTLTQTTAIKMLNLDAAVAANIVRDSIEELHHKDYRLALIEISKLFHSRLSLCTAFLAFLDPENVGVFDDQITSHLVAGDYNHLNDKLADPNFKERLVRPSRETLNKASSRFSMYCGVLGELKNTINQQRMGWTDTSGCHMSRFRVIDVERALHVRVKET